MNTYNRVLDAAKEHRKVADKISTLINLRNKGMADIGGGSGLLAHHLKGHSSHITIIEPSEKMTSYSEDEFTIINSSIQDLKTNKKFDVVLCFDSLHHFPSKVKDKKEEIKRCLDKMIGIAKEDIILIEPNPFTLKGFYLKVQENYLLFQGCYYPCKKEFEELLNDHKFTIELWRSYLIVHVKK